MALGQIGAVSKSHLADFAGCGIEELEKFVMPALLVATAEDPAMVAVTNKGYAITQRGLEELDRRGIPHRGAEVVTVGGQRLDFGSYDPDTSAAMQRNGGCQTDVVATGSTATRPDHFLRVCRRDDQAAEGIGAHEGGRMLTEDSRLPCRVSPCAGDAARCPRHLHVPCLHLALLSEGLKAGENHPDCCENLFSISLSRTRRVQPKEVRDAEV